MGTSEVELELVSGICLNPPSLFLFWLLLEACKILVPQGSNLCPLQCKCGVLTTGPPGTSLPEAL